VSELAEDAAPPPRANPELVGHEAAEAALLAAWNSGRMPHAWLFAGPRGVGKATLAFRFARFALAQGAQKAAESGGLFGATAPSVPAALSLPAEHPVFRRVAAEGHADMMTLRPGMPNPKSSPPNKPSQEIIVHWVRRAVDLLHRTAAEGGWRVVVVDTAEDMNDEAANSLLKALEEPSPDCLLILVSNAPGRLLPTIRSRCRMLHFQPLPDATVDALLQRYRKELSAAERRTLAGLCTGSIGRAIELADSGGAELYRSLLDLLGGLPRLDVAAAHGFAEAMGKRGEDGQSGLRTALELMEGIVHRLAKTAAGEAAVLPDEAQLAARFAGRGARPWIDAWDRLGRLSSAGEGLNLDRKSVLLAALGAFERAAV
jgi:DNA polymerase-3 subunit delta'